MKILNEELTTLENLPVIIESYIAHISDHDRNVKRKDSWSIKEHLYHIADVQSLLLSRIKLIKENENPVIEPFFPAEKTLSLKYETIEDAILEYKEFRKEQISIIRNCDEAILNRSAVHKEYNDYSIPLIVKHMIFHEYWHMYRIEEIWLEKDEYFQ